MIMIDSYNSLTDYLRKFKLIGSLNRIELDTLEEVFDNLPNDLYEDKGLFNLMDSKGEWCCPAYFLVFSETDNLIRVNYSLMQESGYVYDDCTEYNTCSFGQLLSDLIMYYDKRTKDVLNQCNKEEREYYYLSSILRGVLNEYHNKGNF